MAQPVNTSPGRMDVEESSFKLANVVFDPSRNIFGLLIKGVMNKPGILYKVSESLYSINANILSMIVSDPVKDKVDVFFHTASENERKIIERVKKNVEADEIELLKTPVKGLSFQQFFPLKCLLRGEL